MERIFHGLKLLSACGRGAYGEVWYCEDISGRRMALKIVSKKKLGPHWERELRGVINYRRLTENAPGLLQLFHVEEDDKYFFYTMEAADSAEQDWYVPDTLAHRLQDGPLPSDRLFETLSGIFDGIKLIHAAGFTHRDIKPDNILFVNGVPKLADIGLLSSLSVTMTQLAGTLEFIPPEERTLEASETSDRNERQQNDLYAFGKVIYCAVTGNNPGDFPAVPKEMQLTAAAKYFLRLSLVLCNPRPYQRPDSIAKIDKEFAIIKQKLETGEHFGNYVQDAGKSITSFLKWLVWTGWKMIKRYIFILLLLVFGYWVRENNKPFDLSKIDTKLFHSKQAELSMTIPSSWVFLEKTKIPSDKMSGGTEGCADWLKPLLKNADLKKDLEAGNEFIFCDAGSSFADHISIRCIPALQNLSDEKSLQYLFQNKSIMNITIHEKKNVSIASCSGYFADFSYAGQKYRCNSYILVLTDKCILISFVCKEDTFFDRKKEFDAVLKTLKIEK